MQRVSSSRESFVFKLTFKANGVFFPLKNNKKDYLCLKTALNHNSTARINLKRPYIIVFNFFPQSFNPFCPKITVRNSVSSL